MHPEKIVSHEDVVKKEREIEALLRKVLRDPIGDYTAAREKLDRSFEKMQGIATTFGDRLEAVPDTVQTTVKKLQKDINTSIENAIEGMEDKVDSLYDEKVAILAQYLIQFDESVQKTPEQIKEITHTLKENIDALVTEKMLLLSEQIDRLPHAHEAMATKIQDLFEVLQSDFRILTEQQQRKYSGLITSFDQHFKSVKILSSQVMDEIEKTPTLISLNFKEIINEFQMYLKKLVDWHVDQAEQASRRVTAIQEQIKTDLDNHAKIIQEGLDKKLEVVISSSQNAQNSLIILKDDNKLILSMLKNAERNSEKELSILKNELTNLHRNMRSYKTVLMVLLIVILFITCGDGVLEFLKLFHH